MYDTHHPINPDTPITPLSPESEVLEAAAQYDFQARSSREVSFRKGDTILLYAQVRVRGSGWSGWACFEVV